MATTKTAERKRAQTRKLRVVNRYPYTKCKVLRHMFDAVGPIANRRKPRLDFGTLVTFRCDHCTTLRFDVYSNVTRELLYRWYEHPDDYKTERQPIEFWRAALLDELDSSLFEDLSAQ